MTSSEPQLESGAVADAAPADLASLRQGVLFLLRREVRDPALAEDLCSETMRIVLERLQRAPLDDPARLPAFLAQTARNLVIAEWRKSARRRTVTGQDDVIGAHADEASQPGSDIQDHQRAQAVRTVLAEMRTPRDREILVRYYLRDEAKAEICRSLGLSDAHFNRVIYRARERFRMLLEARFSRSDLLCLAL